jgi:hypothetical protein
VRDHSSCDGLRDQPDALQIGIDDLVPIRFILLQGSPRRRHAGVVDDDVNRAEVGFGGVERGLNARRDGDVHHDALSLTVGIGDVVHGFGERIGTARTDGYTGASRREKGGEESPQAARAAGHQHV